MRPAAAASGAIEHAGRKEQVVDAVGIATLWANPRYNRLMHHSTLPRLRVRARPGHRTQGWLTVGSQAIPVALGRGGILANKREGDGGTPRGEFRLLRLWWRADRHPRPQTLLPVRRITGDVAWCEDPRDRRYNRWFRRSAEAPGDRLRRDDHLYDFIIEIDHNSAPRIAGRGSAVFLHLARTNFSPTAGCVSMTKSSMLRLLRRMSPRTRIIIG
jgi:L,D-peptidoglycan transpeptidase YkuD (ErfK/YbiS/YcfS/YnhG family)